MENFAYIGFDQSGARHEGLVPAVDLYAARAKLKDLGLIPISISPAVARPRRRTLPMRWARIGLSDVEFFTTEMALLLKSGVRVDRALEILKKEVGNEVLREVIEDLLRRVRQGEGLSSALAGHSNVFDPLYVNVLQVGEATGELAGAFQDLAGNLKFRRYVANKVRQALAYPSFVAGACFLAVLFIFNFIVPRFALVFKDMPNLPGYTRLFLAAGDIFTRYQLVILPGLAVLAFALIRLWRHAAWRGFWEAWALRLPLIRNFIRSLEGLRFSAAMAVLLRKGVLLPTALDLAVRSMGNRVLRQALAPVSREVRQGKQLSEALVQSGLFSGSLAGLIEVGEETGNLAEVFGELEERFRERYEGSVTRVVNVLEPLLIVIMGLVVGSVIVVMLLSMVSVNELGI